MVGKFKIISLQNVLPVNPGKQVQTTYLLLTIKHIPEL